MEIMNKNHNSVERLWNDFLNENPINQFIGMIISIPIIFVLLNFFNK